MSGYKMKKNPQDFRAIWKKKCTYLTNTSGEKLNALHASYYYQHDRVILFLIPVFLPVFLLLSPLHQNALSNCVKSQL